MADASGLILTSTLISFPSLKWTMKALISFAALCFAVLLFNGFVAAKPHRTDDKYTATCLLTEPTTRTALPCMIALYSVWHTFNISSAPVVILDSKLCSPLAQSLDMHQPTVVVVSRGECAFDVKTQHATDAGFAALVIVNTEENPFLFGDQHSKHADGIPTLMVGSTFWAGSQSLQECQTRNECPELFMNLAYVSKEKPRPRPIDVDSITPLAAWLPAVGFLSLGGTVLALVASASTSYFLTTTSTTSTQDSTQVSTSRKVKTLSCSNYRQGLFLMCWGIILIFSFLCGTATLRKRVLSESDAFMMSDISYVGPYGNKEITFNHRETDELIFETLTATVSKNFWDYSLQSSGIIETFRLSKENYDDDIFIHPPFFVYSLYFLFHFLGMPLVLASVMFHTLTAALIAPLALGLHSPLLSLTSDPSTTYPIGAEKSKHGAYSVALWATVFFIMCPIGRITSQKVWIDNAAVFTATFAAVIHMYLLRSSRTLKHSTIKYRNLLSGLMYGFIALNCKITSLAMLPFLLSWTVLAGVWSHPQTAAASILSSEHIFRMISNCAHFVAGVITGHGPWVFLYHSITGRFLPNAWPSKEMIQNSLYLQAAMNRNWAAYIIDLFKFSPLQLVGLLFGLCALVFALHSILQFSRCYHGSLKTAHSLLLSQHLLQRWALASFTLWPVGFVGGLTLIGCMGGGFQIRFIVPILPATSVLASMAVTAIDTMLYPVVALLLVYSGMHSLFYSVLYSPLFADMHASVFDIIRTILESPYDAPASDINFMKHFGLKLD